MYAVAKSGAEIERDLLRGPRGLHGGCEYPANCTYGAL